MAVRPLAVAPPYVPIRMGLDTYGRQIVQGTPACHDDRYACLAANGLHLTLASLPSKGILDLRSECARSISRLVSA